MKTNQRTINVFDVKGKFLGNQTFDERFNRHDIIKLLNTKYPWEWEYYE